MNILVTGGAGYLGSVLVPRLVARGHRVRVLDLGYFGTEHLRSMVEVLREDIRRVIGDHSFCRELLSGCDCVVHLAAVSNDPSAELNPELTHEVNHRATVSLAEMARSKGVRFLFSSSCSVYGEGNGLLDESGSLKPLTTYAVSKVAAERVLEEMGGGDWSPVILRNGTLFGYSPRMRFDLVVNIFSLYSALHGEIKIFGPGLQWRPYLHVRDCARAFAFFAEKERCRHICYNVAHENRRVADLAEVFRGINPRLRVTHLQPADADRRDYRVDTTRIRKEGFVTRIGLEEGAEEMVEAIVSGRIRDPESIYYRNAKWLKELTSLGSKNHTEILGFMETLTQLRPAAS